MWKIENPLYTIAQFFIWVNKLMISSLRPPVYHQSDTQTDGQTKQRVVNHLNVECQDQGLSVLVVKREINPAAQLDKEHKCFAAVMTGGRNVTDVII